MIDLQNPSRILPVAVLIIYLVIEGLFQQTYSKDLILENEEDVFVSGFYGHSLNVQCGYWGEYTTINFEWKQIENNMWYTKSGKTEIISRSQWLGFKNVNGNDEGQYSCSIDGTNGNETFSAKRGFIMIPKSKQVFYRLNIKPTFLTNLTENVPLIENSTLHLLCPFKSNGDTVYSWYKNDKLLIERKAIIQYADRIENEYSYKTLLRLSDAGNYTCLVRNTFGSIQHTFSVVVYEDGNKMPLYNGYPRHLSLKTGDTARFFCKNIDYYYSLEWYFSNFANPMYLDMQTVDFQQFKKIQNTTESVGNSNVQVNWFNSELVLEHVTIDDAGWYFCVTRGRFKMLKAEARLDVDKGKK